MRKSPISAHEVKHDSEREDDDVVEVVEVTRPSKRRKVAELDDDENDAGIFIHLPPEVFVVILGFLPTKDAVALGASTRSLLRLIWAFMEVLDLKNLPHRSKSIASAQRALYLCRRLEEFRLRHFPSNENSVTFLFERMSFSWSRLTKLDVKGCQFMSKDNLAHIAKCVSLRDLNLSYCTIDPAADPAVLTSLTNLQLLDLSWSTGRPFAFFPSQLQTLGIAAVGDRSFPALTQCQALSSLDIRATNIELSVTQLTQLTCLKSTGFLHKVSDATNLRKLSIRLDLPRELGFSNLVSLACQSIAWGDLTRFVDKLCHLHTLKMFVSTPLLGIYPHPTGQLTSLRTLKLGKFDRRVKALGLKAVESCKLETVFREAPRLFPNLRDLKICNFAQDERSGQTFWIADIPTFPSLSSLDLREGTLYNDVIEAICAQLPNLLDLTMIACRLCSIRPSALLKHRTFVQVVE